MKNDNDMVTAGNREEYRESIKNLINTELKNALDADMRRAAQELLDEQRKAVKQMLEEQRAIIRQVIEEEKKVIWKRAEELKKTTVFLSPQEPAV